MNVAEDVPTKVGGEGASDLVEGSQKPVSPTLTLSRYWFGLLRVIAKSVEYPNVYIYDGGFRVEGFSVDHMVYVVAEFSTFKLGSFEQRQGKSFQIDLADFTRRVKLKADEHCVLGFEGNVLKVTIRHMWRDEQRIEEFEVNETSVSAWSERFANLVFDAEFSIRPSVLRRLLEAISVVDDKVRISCVNGLCLAGDGMELRLKVDCVGQAEAVYSVERLLDILGVSDDLVSEAVIAFSTNRPMRISMRAAGVGAEIQFYVAPRLS